MLQRFLGAGLACLMAFGCAGGVGEEWGESGGSEEVAEELGTLELAQSSGGVCEGEYVVGSTFSSCGFVQCPRGCFLDGFFNECNFNFSSAFCGFPQCRFPCFDAGDGTCLRETVQTASCSGLSESSCRATSGCSFTPRICTPKSKFCSGDKIQTCSSDGTQVFGGRTCPFGCANGVCQPQPEPEPGSCPEGTAGPDCRPVSGSCRLIRDSDTPCTPGVRWFCSSSGTRSCSLPPTVARKPNGQSCGTCGHSPCGGIFGNNCSCGCGWQHF